MKFKPIWILHAIVAIIITTLFVFQQMEYKKVYEEATALAEAGDYDKAYSKMKKIEQYHDASDKTTEYDLEIDYREGNALIEEKEWEKALPIFESILSRDNYKNSQYLKHQCIYEQALDAAYAGELIEAERKLISLPLNFKDVSERKQVIADNKKYKGTWQCTDSDMDLRTVVFIDKDNIPRVNAELIDHDAMLLDEPITLKGDGLEITGNKFSWEISPDTAPGVSYSFVYDSEKFTALKQPVTEGSTKITFERMSERDYDRINSEYTTTEF